MAVISVYILLVIFESSKVLSDAFNTYCTLPCPFMGPAQPPRTCGCGAIQLPPRSPNPAPRSSFNDNYSDYEDPSEDEQQQQPVPINRSRQLPPTREPPPPKPKRKTPPEDPEPPPKKKSPTSSAPSSPSIQPSRRFFTSLFSIPGAVVDTLVSGEIVL